MNISKQNVLVSLAATVSAASSRLEVNLRQPSIAGAGCFGG